MRTRRQTGPALAVSDRGFVQALGLPSATALNMAQMVGIGPFITIPLIIGAMGGPQAVLGWVVGALIALVDGLVWAELGAAMPRSGGTYTFLREAFQYKTGRLMPFMFVWSTILVTPLIMATGMIGMTDYLGYFFGMSSMESHLIAVGFTVFTVALLYRRIDSVARLTNLLWAGMIVTVLVTIIAAFSHFTRTWRSPTRRAPGTWTAGSSSGSARAWCWRSSTTSATTPSPTSVTRCEPRQGHAVVDHHLHLRRAGHRPGMNIGIIGVAALASRRRSRPRSAPTSCSAVWGHAAADVVAMLDHHLRVRLGLHRPARRLPASVQRGP